MLEDAQGYREEVGLKCCWTCAYRVLNAGTPRVFCAYPRVQAFREAVTPIGLCNWWEQSKFMGEVRLK